MIYKVFVRHMMENGGISQRGSRGAQPPWEHDPREYPGSTSPWERICCFIKVFGVYKGVWCVEFVGCFIKGVGVLSCWLGCWCVKLLAWWFGGLVVC